MAAESETWMGGPQREFATTLWTVVVNAKNPASPERREALQKLIETYWKPLYHYVRRKGQDREAAKDAVQGFFTALLEKDLLQYLQPGRAKFRTFLLIALKHHMSDAWDRASALKRGGSREPLSLDFAEAEKSVAGSKDDTPEQAFKREWGLGVLEQALHSLKVEFVRADRGSEFEAIKPHLAFGAGEKRSHAELAAELQLTESEVRHRIQRTRVRYRELVLDVIRSYTETPDQVEEELADLFSALS